MDELIMTIEGEGPPRSWWIGDGIWWLMIEGLGMVYTYEPTSMDDVHFDLIDKEGE